MNTRLYRIEPDCVQFLVQREYPNHSKRHWHIQHKGAFYTRCTWFKAILGWLWKRFGIGGRK